MRSTDRPARIPLAFATSGARNTIPVASQIAVTPGAASLADGFPPICMKPRALGGQAPFEQDMNGILYAISANTVWYCAGGAVTWDAGFATAAGGYPAGARLASLTTGLAWLNFSDANATDPDGPGAAGWVPAPNFQGKIQVFTASGQFIVSLGTTRLKMRLWAAGGGGGAGQGGGGGGGGGGGSCDGWIDVAPGEPLAVTIAQGGTGQGGDATVTRGGVELAGASGGGPGTAGPNGLGGTPGAGRILANAPFGESGAQGLGSGPMWNGGKGGNAFGFAGGVNVLLPSGTSQAGTNAQVASGGGGGVGGGAGGIAGGGVVIFEW
jgi:hypothetical protein